MPLLTVTALAETGAAASFDVAAIMQAAVIDRGRKNFG